LNFNFGIYGTEEGGKGYTNYLIRKEEGRYNLENFGVTGRKI
jgi:hypothetical protein